MRIVIGEDSTLIREGLIRILGDDEFEIVGQAAEAEDLRREVRARRPDLAIIDVMMPPGNRLDGLEAAIELRDELPELAVLVLSAHVEEAFSRTLLAGRADGVGYLLKDRAVDIEGFKESVRRVASGGSALDPEVVAELLGNRHDPGDPLRELTGGEMKVLRLIAEGNASSGIARQLDLDEGTAERQANSIFRKLGLRPGDETHRRVLAVRSYLQNN